MKNDCEVEKPVLPLISHNFSTLQKRIKLCLNGYVGLSVAQHVIQRDDDGLHIYNGISGMKFSEAIRKCDALTS